MKIVWIVILVVLVALLWFFFGSDYPEWSKGTMEDEKNEEAVMVKDGDVLPSTIEKLRDVTATAVGVSRDKVTVIKYRKTVWPNGCLGSTPPEGEECAEGEVPGYGGQFQVGETIYDYHASNDVSSVVLHGTLEASSGENEAMEAEGSETTEE